MPENWNAIADRVLARIECPDLFADEGLENAVTNFDVIYTKLLKHYDANGDSISTLIAIVAVCARMCSSPDLCHKLFEKDFLLKLAPLLDNLSHRPSALQLLAKISVHAVSVHLASTVSTHTMEALITILHPLPSNATSSAEEQATLELAFIIAARITCSVIQESKIGLEACKIDVRKLLDAGLHLFQNGTSSFKAFYHTIFLMRALSYRRNLVDHLRKDASILQILVLSLRCSSLNIRLASLDCLLHIDEGELDAKPPSMAQIVSAMKTGLKGSVSKDILRDTPYRSPQELMASLETVRMMKSYESFIKMMAKFDETRDFRSLGLEVYPLILGSEASFIDPWDESEQAGPGLDILVTPARILPVCAKKIRDRGIAKESEIADVLYLKWALSNTSAVGRHRIADTAIKRNPGNAYLYYIRSLRASPTEGLEIARKGLMCSGLTDFLRSQLLNLVVEHSLAAALQSIGDLEISGSHGVDGPRIARLKSAFGDSANLTLRAPLDGFRTRKTILSHVFLCIAYKGSEISQDLTELQPILRLLAHADQIYKGCYGRIERTKERIVVDLIKSHSATAPNTFENELSRINRKFRSEAPFGVKDWHLGTPTPDDTLALWLEGKAAPAESKVDHVEETSVVGVNFCSACLVTSKTLKACSGCQKVWYCDAVCQKRDWKEGHKSICKRRN